MAEPSRQSRPTIEPDPIPLTRMQPAHEHKPACSECGEVLEDLVLLGADGKPTRLGWRKIGEQLIRPMPTHQARKPGGTYTYLTARQVTERLDAVVGPGNWSTTYRVLSTDPWAVECSVAIFGVAKGDVGYSNNPTADEGDRDYEAEPAKAAYSDAFKRAATRWGIGRWLQKGPPTP